MPLQPNSVTKNTAELGLEDFFKAAARTAADIATLIRWKNSLARSRPAVQAAFIKWRNLVALEVIRGMNRNQSLRQDAAKIVDNLTDWPALEEKARGIFEKTFVRIFEDAAAAELPEIAKGLTIPKVSPASIASYNWSYRNSAKLVTEITADQRNSINAIIRSGGLAGTSVKTMASKIRPTIGLHSTRLAAVDKYRTGLEAKGLPKGQIDKLVNQRTAKELRLRAEMIARTETAKARMEGVLFQHKKMGITQVRWLADPECCGECLARSGKIYSIAEASGQIPKHPKCECHFVAATAADLKQSPSWPFTGEPPKTMPQLPQKPAEPKPKKPQQEFGPDIPMEEWADEEKEIVWDWTGNGYDRIRKIISGRWAPPKEWIPSSIEREKKKAAEFLKLFNKYGRTAGARDKTLYRGITVPEDLYSKIRKFDFGDINPIDTAPQSWSTSRVQAEGFLNGDSRVLFKLAKNRTTTTEIDLSKTFNPGEAEVIMKNTVFRVRRVTEKKSYYYKTLHVELEEVVAKAEMNSRQIAEALSQSQDWKMLRNRKKKKPRVEKRRRTMNR